MHGCLKIQVEKELKYKNRIKTKESKTSYNIINNYNSWYKDYTNKAPKGVEQRVLSGKLNHQMQRKICPYQNIN